MARDGRTVYVGSSSHTGSGYSYLPGDLEVYAVAPDGSLALRQTIAQATSQLALTPDGSRLFVRSPAWDIVSFPVTADGSLGLPGPVTTAGGGGAMSFVVNSDGTAMYASVYPYFVEQWAIGVAGSLTPQFPTDLGGCWGATVGIPPGSDLLDLMCGGSSLTFALGPGGALAQIGSTYPESSGYYAADVRGPRPLCRRLPALDRAGPAAARRHPRELSRGRPHRPRQRDRAGGRPVRLAARGLDRAECPEDVRDRLRTARSRPSPVATVATTAASFSSLTFAPDRSPVAALDAAAAGETVTFDARASHPVDGTIARYDWSFGDGTALADAGPAPTHVLSARRRLHRDVTVTDSSGCSVAGTYSGTMAICAGSAAAAASRTLHVADAVTQTPAAESPKTVTQSPAADGSTTVDLPRPLAAAATRNLRGDKVLVTWRQPEGSAPPIRYLLAWSTLHSAHGPADPNMHHLYWTAPHIMLRTKPGTTLHLAVYAQMPGGTFTRATKTTLRLR